MSPYGWIVLSKHWSLVNLENQAIWAHISPTGKGEVMWHNMCFVKFVLLTKSNKKWVFILAKRHLQRNPYLERPKFQYNFWFLVNYFNVENTVWWSDQTCKISDWFRYLLFCTSVRAKLLCYFFFQGLVIRCIVARNN